MAYNLTIDQGNSTTKVALWDMCGNLVNVASKLSLGARDVPHLAEGEDIENVIFCTVCRRPPAMMKALARRCKHAIEFTADTPIPLKNDYKSASTLGLDRLAAAVGAYSLVQGKNKNLLVVDLGTAITYDRVSADAHFLGGNIAPGIRMRLKALNHYTARLPMVDPRQNSVPVWGDTTVSALLCGAVRGVVAEIEYYRAMSGDNTEVVLTGGYTDLVKPLLSFTPTVEPNLVLLGLKNIIEYNTDK